MCLRGDSSTLAWAQLVRQWSDDVVFFVHTYDLTQPEREQLEARGIQIVQGRVAQLVVEADRLTGVQLADGRIIPRAAVFIRPRFVPHADGLLTGLGCEVDDAGFVDPRVQVIASAGAGNAAAIAINADLVQEDVKRAVDDHHAASGVFSSPLEARLTDAALGDRRHGF